MCGSAFAEHEIVRRALGIAADTEIRSVADDRLSFRVSVAAFPGGAAVGIGAVHAGDDRVGPIQSLDVHLKDGRRRIAAWLMLLRQPNLEALAFEEARQF